MLARLAKTKLMKPRLMNGVVKCLECVCVCIIMVAVDIL